ncbi:hypothetical protein [Chachezhania antarctica]|uniref:hypothetical protein n=1 Tax=Chachezhania antarctica TaxID=2340860 RepID=UPI000EAE31EB|nr:hypothetical protein [Chachezhania antarctica]|tara:strand:- start:506 stop:1051 length:546 start_codon:yes stop_codon:yes gene_type:complete
MTDTIDIPAREHGLIRLFSLDMPPERVKFLSEPGATAQVLGVEELDHAQVDIFKVEDMEDIGLTGYLVEGLGVPRQQVAAETETLDAVQGWVMAVRSRAFAEKAVTLTLDPDVKPIATFAEAHVEKTGAAPVSESAEPYSAPQPDRVRRAQRAKKRQAGIVILIVSLGLLAALASLAVHFL